MLDHEGKEAPGQHGYKYVCGGARKTALVPFLIHPVLPAVFFTADFSLPCPCRYFGAAKDLPGVRELFEEQGRLLWKPVLKG